jgi:hypothetical protein
MGRSSLDAMNAWWICAVRARRDARLPTRRAREGAAFFAGAVFDVVFFFVFDGEELVD